MRENTMVFIIGLVIVLFILLSGRNGDQCILNQDGTVDLRRKNWFKEVFYPLRVIEGAWHYKDKNGQWVELFFDDGSGMEEEIPIPPLGR